MSMCYLCDLCANESHKAFRYGIDLLPCETGGRRRKLPIDYGKQDPHEICKHFEPKEGGDD